MSKPPRLTIGNRDLVFEPVQLVFAPPGGVTDVFAGYRKKTLGETIRRERFKDLAERVEQLHAADLNKPLGSFLLGLKQNGDLLYREFLNPHGDGEFCEFSVQGDLARNKGLYCYTLDGTVKYIGRSHDPFSKRVNEGYGKIYPKNCYRDGQATNCHLNSLVAASDAVQFWVLPLESDAEIDDLERALIEKYQPDWNIALKGKQPEPQEAPDWTGLALGIGSVCVLMGIMLVGVALYQRKQVE